jgi:NAD+ kinase
MKNLKVYVVSNNSHCSVYEEVAGRFEVTSDIADCDIVITIGGDGTILRVGKTAAKLSKPLLGINTGTLGFMATLEKNELSLLERLKTKEYSISRRMLLNVSDVSGGSKVAALNDVVLHRKASRLPEFVVCKDDVEIIRVRADGIIVASPTGSTAYSLSAGGPIIEPSLECFLVSLICPHTLFNRTMMFSQGSKLSVSADGVYVSVDGVEIEYNDGVTITKSQHYLDLIDINGNNFYDSIHNKLMKPLK